jgi:hypothetical protein
MSLVGWSPMCGTCHGAGRVPVSFVDQATRECYAEYRPCVACQPHEHRFYVGGWPGDAEAHSNFYCRTLF